MSLWFYIESKTKKLCDQLGRTDKIPSSIAAGRQSTLIFGIFPQATWAHTACAKVKRGGEVAEKWGRQTKMQRSRVRNHKRPKVAYFPPVCNLSLHNPFPIEVAAASKWGQLCLLCNHCATKAKWSKVCVATVCHTHAHTVWCQRRGNSGNANSQHTHVHTV